MRENLDKALAIDPNHLFSLSYMGDLMYKSKSFDSAKIYQSRLLELGDKNPIDRAMMANILYLGKDYEGAIALIQEIISGDNKYTYLNRLIGYSYFETKKPNEAIAFLEKFIQTEPKEKIIGSDYEYLAKSYTAAGQPEKGIEILNSALALNPNDKDLMIQIAKEYKDLKKLDEALMMYQKILALTDPAPTADDYKNQANLYFSKKDWVNAEAGYTKVLELAPTSTMVYYNRASVKSYADPEQTTASAKPDFVKFMELATGNEAYKKQLTKANIYMAKDAIKNLSDKVAGKGFLDAALALDPTNAEALDLLKFVE
jgi:tetratricopeptide (TPR) repeat protein